MRTISLESDWGLVGQAWLGEAEGPLGKQEHRTSGPWLSTLTPGVGGLLAPLQKWNQQASQLPRAGPGSLLICLALALKRHSSPLCS